MRATTSDFAALRPRLYHLTARSNLSEIRTTGRLYPASDLLKIAGKPDQIRLRRPDSIQLSLGGRSIHVRDQLPLHEGNVSLQEGWTFADFVQHLNEHVFFWPGTVRGPIAFGIRHFARYAHSDNAVLVVSTEALVAANPGSALRVSRFNSGSPRCSGGRRSPRGPQTFQTLSEYKGTLGSVVEATFRGTVQLPAAFELAEPRDFL